MLPVLRYTVLRLALFVASLGVLALVGARGLLLLVLAAGVSFALSYILLWRARNDVSRVISDRMAARLEGGSRSGFARRLREDTEVEDAAVDAAAGEAGPENRADREKTGPN